jgi:ABC-2 type transport system ATP-binding protein
MALIEAYGLTKRYGVKTAVENLSFHVRPGAVTGFLGPNGSGKSTTMRMILGLDTPTAGHVTVNGKRYKELPNAARQVGALLDAKAVHGGRSARQHLLCVAQLSGIPARRVDEVLGVVGLQDVAHRRSKGFSLGMGQRLGIAGALLGDPQVLLFDEPVNGLDPEGIHWVRNLMRKLAAEGRTVFVSSHLMSEMALTADHLIVIGRGRLLADMSVKEFIEHNSAGFARVRTPAESPEQREKLAAALAEAGGQVQPEQDGALRVSRLDLPRISDVAFGLGVRLHELSPHQASLEEAYMRMTQGMVDYRSTQDPRAGLQQAVPMGYAGPQGWGAPNHPYQAPPQGWGAPPPVPVQGYGAPPGWGAPAMPPTAVPPAAMPPAAVPTPTAVVPPTAPPAVPPTPTAAVPPAVPPAPAAPPASPSAPDLTKRESES